MTVRRLPINLTAVAKRDEGQFVLLQVEIVNYAVVADAKAELISSGHAVMRKGVKTASHVVNFSHD